MAATLAFVHETTAEDYRRVIEVTHLGQVHGTLAALKRMRPRDDGVIVMVGSALAYRGIPLQAGYCAAKHATRGFADALRCELMHEDSGVRITTVHGIFDDQGVTRSYVWWLTKRRGALGALAAAAGGAALTWRRANRDRAALAQEAAGSAPV